MLTAVALVALVLTLVVVVATVGILFRRENELRALHEEAVAAGMEVPSLYPVIDPDLCISSGACVDACPEKVLGMVDGKTRLVQPGDCIGHGRCQNACPVEAISLVFGTAKRGVDIPRLRAGYETNVDGIFVIGELGGMGLLRNAMRQGMQVIDSVKRVLADPYQRDPEVRDLVIVGGGPAGVACALKAKEQGLTFHLLEQYSLGGSVTHYPRRKFVHTERIKLPLVGAFGKSEMLKEELVAEFERVLLEAQITMQEGRRVTAVRGQIGGYTVLADGPDGRQETYRGRAIVLAIGRRGTPRKLGVPGEDLAHVVYRLIDPEQYRHRKVMVVGGGDSAVEAAVALAGVAGTTVYLSYRNKAFFRVKKKNREHLEAAVEEGRVQLLLETEVVSIGREDVVVKGPRGQQRLPVQDVIVNAGGVLPTPFLESLGVEVETKRGDAAEADKPSARIARQVATGIARASQRFTGSWRGPGPKDSQRASGEQGGDAGEGRRGSGRELPPKSGRASGRKSGRKDGPAA